MPATMARMKEEQGADRMWSRFVQSPEDLYASRSMRFRSDNKDLWLGAMKLADGMKILEVGCGPGAFCHRIKAFLPGASVTGIDRDAGHVEHAAAKSRELGVDCAFLVGDALSLPFADGSFDACSSHTVIEHVETGRFLSEQLRVLKSGGVASVLSVRASLNVAPENWKPVDPEEAALLEKAWEKAGNYGGERGVGAHPLKESVIPAALDRAGFRDVAVGFISVVPYAPDSADVSQELALEQINANWIAALSSMENALRIFPSGLSDGEKARLAQLINQRHDDRIGKYLRGEKLWDIATSTVMAVTGRKP